MGRRPASLVVVVTPNVAFITNRLALLFGRFNYTDRGILDIQHRRLFNRVSLRRTLRDCGYTIESIEPVAVPFEAVVGGSRSRAPREQEAGNQRPGGEATHRAIALGRRSPLLWRERRSRCRSR